MCDRCLASLVAPVPRDELNTPLPFYVQVPIASIESLSAVYLLLVTVDVLSMPCIPGSTGAACVQVEEVAATNGAQVEYVPILLGALFKEIGTPNMPILVR